MKSEFDNNMERLSKLCDEAATRLREHCDSVQIFVTYHGEDGQSTGSYEVGRGNFFARQGQIQEWLEIQQQYQRNEAIRRDARSRDDDDKDGR